MLLLLFPQCADGTGVDLESEGRGFRPGLYLMLSVTSDELFSVFEP